MKKNPVPEIAKTAKEGAESDLLAMLVSGWDADLTHRDIVGVFLLAAGRGFAAAVTELLRCGVDAGASTGRFSALGMASKYARPEVVRLLLAHHADADVRNDRRDTPLMLACREVCEWPDQIADYRAVVSELLAAGADPNAENTFKETALLLVCAGCRPVFKEDLTIPQLLISRGADVKHVADGWNTAIRNAAMAGNVPLVRLLLEHGHPIDVGVGVDYTPLMMAARWGRADVVQLLLRRDADPNAVSRHGETALLAACEENHLQAVRALVAGGADWKTPTAKGTLREIAENRKALDVVQYLDSLS